MSKTKKEQIKSLDNILKSKMIYFMPSKNPFYNCMNVKIDDVPELKKQLKSLRDKLKSEVQNEQ
jgi:cell division protein FtsX